MNINKISSRISAFYDNKLDNRTIEKINVELGQSQNTGLNKIADVLSKHGLGMRNDPYGILKNLYDVYYLELKNKGLPVRNVQLRLFDNKGVLVFRKKEIEYDDWSMEKAIGPFTRAPEESD